MISRRTILALITSIGTIAASGVALAKKQKKHQNGRALLGDNIKKNGKHKLHKAGKVDVSVDVSNGKVVGLTAAHPTKGNLQARKVKSRQKLADTQPEVIQTSMRMAQASDWYYGWWFVDDEEDDWYYWFPADVVIVDETWIVYGQGRADTLWGIEGQVSAPRCVTCANHLFVAKSCGMTVNAEESPRR